jgi:GNAT superfamily N-acetyltransferase
MASQVRSRRVASIEIRPARISDAPVLADFNARMAWETERRRLNRARVTRGVRALLNDPARGIYFVAEQDGQIAGQLLITFEWSDWRNGNFWWIQSVYVAPPFRERGVFRALYDHVHRLARRRRDVCGLRLYVDADNTRAQRTYRRLGMKPSHYRFFEVDFVLP